MLNGGDNIAITLDVLQGAVQDIGQNKNPIINNIFVKDDINL